jgi:tRNA-specific 2-thiouridylase
MHWINPAPSQTSLRCHAKIRYRQADQACTVTIKTDVSGGGIHVVFDEPQRAVAPGQSVVLYDGEHCLGGAVINSRSN